MEGSGTTMVTKILSECQSCLGLTTNWNVSELSPGAQKRYDTPVVEASMDLGTLTLELWRDSAFRHYVNNQRDTRVPAARERMLAEARDLLDKALAGHPSLDNIIYHRSMPFHTHLQTPFLEDLPALVPGGQAHLVLVVRFPPSFWASMKNLQDYKVYLSRVDRLIAGRETIPGLTMTLVSYEYLCYNPQSALAELAAELPGVDLSDLLLSPMLDNIREIAEDRDSEKYRSLIGQYSRHWDNVRQNYPAFDAFQRAGEERCRSESLESGEPPGAVESVLAKIHTEVEAVGAV